MSLSNKKTQNVSREALNNILAVARGDGPGTLLIKNIKILDLINGGLLDSAIMIAGKIIAGTGAEYNDSKADKVIDGKGLVAVPGFIDGHLHVESSMMNPFEFENMTLPLGTTTAICDPHEITNVLGEEGFNWFLRCSEKMHQNFFIQTPSCVPALLGVETNGGEFTLESMRKTKGHPNILGLAEMMNFPGVINGDEKTLDKLQAFSDLNLDGHCPLLRGKALNAYIAAGIQNCHETITEEEGLEKLQKGMSLIIREGSVAKNLKTLAPLVTEFNSSQCFLCTDDRNPYELLVEGHINFMIKKMIKDLGMPVHIAYRLSSFSAAKHFGLKRLGLIAPGKQADIVLLNNLEEVGIEKVFVSGVDITELDLENVNNLKVKIKNSLPPIENSIKRKKLKESDFSYNLKAGKYNVIEIIKEQIITNHLVSHYDGEKFDQEDILYMVNVERYGLELPPALGLVKGLGLTSGAIAATIAHDSHNLLAIGKNISDIVVALNALIDSGGGLCVVSDKTVLSLLELPIAGLISKKSGFEIFEDLKKIKAASSEIGAKLEEPFIQMAFLALPVIPKLKLTDKGLFDVTTFTSIPLRAED